MKTDFWQKLEILKLKFYIKLPFILIFMIIMILYFNYMTMHIIPNYLTSDKYDLSIFLVLDEKYKISLVFFHLLLIMVITTMFKTLYTDPGNVPEDWNHQYFEKVYNKYIDEKANKKAINQSGGNFFNFLNLNFVKEVNINNNDFKKFLSNKKIRFCKYCEKFKPDRSHHCRQCSKCILKMDHHCNWILTCIGYRNYKYFLQFIVYSEILLIFYTLNFTESILWNDLMIDPAKGIRFFFKCTNWLFALSLSFLLGLLNFLHFGLLTT